MQDPEPYLRGLNLQIPCVVFPKKMARIDTSMRYRIGHDLFYFSSAQARTMFLRNPRAYAKQLSDPVTSDRFRWKAKTLKTAYRGRDYCFMADSTRAKFLADPDRYRDRRAVPVSEAGME